jgi:two-component system response regulator RegX3
VSGSGENARRDDSSRGGWGLVRILVVEDDAAIAEPLVVGLRREGFEVSAAKTASEALAAPPADLVLLDLGLPDGHGFDVCRQLRTRSAVPIIIVTAREDEVDRVAGLELGADDYVVKPFGFRELVARIRAVTRRVGTPAQPGGPQQIGDLCIDRRSHRVTLEGEELPLTPKEFDLLALLATDPGAMVTRREILSEVWDPHWYGTSKTVDVHIASLRRKLGHPEWIETSRGVGFRLAVPQ